MVGVRRIQITGGPGAGKTRLARRLSEQLGVRHIDIDGLALRLSAKMPKPLDLLALMERRLPIAARLARGDAWISDGSNLDASIPFYESADLIVLMRCSWRVASYRIVMRHVKAELSRSNRFPGWRSLYRFWRWSGRFYANGNPHASNAWGTPETDAYMIERLSEYEPKLVVCRNKDEVAEVERRLLGVEASGNRRSNPGAEAGKPRPR